MLFALSTKRFANVNDLINPNTNRWAEDLVTQMFWFVDVRIILSIPLADYQMEDFVAWSLTRSCMFLVKSAYHVELEAHMGRK